MMSLGLGLGIKVPKHLSSRARIQSAAIHNTKRPLGGAEKAQ